MCRIVPASRVPIWVPIFACLVGIRAQMGPRLGGKARPRNAVLLNAGSVWRKRVAAALSHDGIEPVRRSSMAGSPCPKRQMPSAGCTRPERPGNGSKSRTKAVKWIWARVKSSDRAIGSRISRTCSKQETTVQISSSCRSFIVYTISSDPCVCFPTLVPYLDTAS
jgi:hypothetical protein